MNLYESNALEPITGGVLRPGGLEITRCAMEMAGAKRGQTLLDVGCGNGKSIAFLREEYGLLCRGIDLSQKLIEEAQEKLGEAIQCSDAARLPFANKSFDIVLAECSFSLIEEKEEALLEMDRVLKAEGKLLIADMYLREGISKKGSGSCIFGAKRREESEALFRKAGFKIRMFEDYTKELKELMGNIIFAYGDLGAFFAMGGADEVCMPHQDMKLGYGLTMLEKERI